MVSWSILISFSQDAHSEVMSAEYHSGSITSLASRNQLVFNETSGCRALTSILTIDKKASIIEPEPAVYKEDVEERLERIENKVELISDVIDSIEDRFEGYNAALALYENRITKIEQFQAAAGMVGAWKASTCRFQEEGVCKLWRLSPDAAKELGDIVVEENGVTRVVVAKAPWFCALCPLYKQRKQATEN